MLTILSQLLLGVLLLKTTPSWYLGQTTPTSFPDIKPGSVCHHTWTPYLPSDFSIFGPSAITVNSKTESVYYLLVNTKDSSPVLQLQSTLCLTTSYRQEIIFKSYLTAAGTITTWPLNAPSAMYQFLSSYSLYQRLLCLPVVCSLNLKRASLCVQLATDQYKVTIISENYLGAGVFLSSSSNTPDAHSTRS